MLFNREAAFCGIIYLCIGDLSAVTVGKNFVRIKIFEKTLEGSLAFAVSTIIVLFLLKYFGVVHLSTLGIVVGAVVCAVVELLPINIDDNLTIPLTGAVILKFLG